MTVIHDIFFFIHMFIIIIILLPLFSHFFLLLVRHLALGVLQIVLIPFLQTLTNAKNRHTTAVRIFSASILRVLSGAHTTTVEKAVRVRNQCLMCSWTFVTFKKKRIVTSAIDHLLLAILNENDTILKNRSDVVKKEEGTIEFSLLDFQQLWQG